MVASVKSCIQCNCSRALLYVNCALKWQNTCGNGLVNRQKRCMVQHINQCQNVELIYSQCLHLPPHICTWLTQVLTTSYLHVSFSNVQNLECASTGKVLCKVVWVLCSLSSLQATSRTACICAKCPPI